MADWEISRSKAAVRPVGGNAGTKCRPVVEHACFPACNLISITAVYYSSWGYEHIRSHTV